VNHLYDGFWIFGLRPKTKDSDSSMILISLLVSFWLRLSEAFNPANCTLTTEGQFAIGIFFGSSIFEMAVPSDRNCQQNPILACIDVDDVPAAFVADPFLYVDNDEIENPWYIFFEVLNTDKTLARRHGQIGAAVSTDKVNRPRFETCNRYSYILGVNLEVLANCPQGKSSPVVPLRFQT
jgi:hypothetical protein